MDAATRSTLTDQLHSLGVLAGLPLMLHSSLRKVGPIVGGAKALLDALVDATSPGGTLMTVLGADLSVPFDANTTPVDVEETRFTPPPQAVHLHVFRRVRSRPRRRRGVHLHLGQAMPPGSDTAVSAIKLRSLQPPLIP